MDPYKKIAEDWTNELNGEFRRGKYPATKLNVNWFDAVDGRTITARDRKGSKLAQLAPKGIEAAKLWQPINEIP